MNIGVNELIIIAGIVACLGIVMGGALVGLVYFLKNRNSGNSAG